jgi:hypothetical protein
MESKAAVPVVPATGADGTSNGVKFRDNYIGAGFTLTLNASYSDWEISGNYPAGNLTVVDSGNFIFFQQGSLFSGRYFFKARSATDFAVRFIPFDDTSPTSYVLSGTNAAQSVTTWGITQNGIFRSFVATGSAPLTVASTTNVTNLNADLLDGVHYFTGSASLSWAAIAANTCVDNGTTITVTGAADGDVVLTGVVNAMGSTANVEFSAYTSAANTVKVRACNVATAASGAISAATVKVGVFH